MINFSKNFVLRFLENQNFHVCRKLHWRGIHAFETFLFNGPNGAAVRTNVANSPRQDRQGRIFWPIGIFFFEINTTRPSKIVPLLFQNAFNAIINFENSLKINIYFLLVIRTYRSSDFIRNSKFYGTHMFKIRKS